MKLSSGKLSGFLVFLEMKIYQNVPETDLKFFKMPEYKTHLRFCVKFCQLEETYSIIFLTSEVQVVSCQILYVRALFFRSLISTFSKSMQ